MAWLRKGSDHDSTDSGAWPGTAQLGWWPESGFVTLGSQPYVSSGLSDLKAIQTQADCTSFHRGHKAKNEWSHVDSLVCPR